MLFSKIAFKLFLVTITTVEGEGEEVVISRQDSAVGAYLY